MAAEIVVLSGPYQGQPLDIPADTLIVGGDPEKGILMEPGVEARNILEGVVLRRTAEGWRIRPFGRARVWVNETALTNDVALCGGDIVRLSQQGPDFFLREDQPPVGSVPPKSDLAGILVKWVGSSLVVVGGIALMWFVLARGRGGVPVGLREQNPAPSRQPTPGEKDTAGLEQFGNGQGARKDEGATPATSPPGSEKASPRKSPEKLSLFNAKITDAVYLVMVHELSNAELPPEPTVHRNDATVGTFFPFASACAIGDARLLTSGRVVIEIRNLLAEKNEDGTNKFDAFVCRSGDINDRQRVERLLVHRDYTDPNQSFAKRMFFDFGLLEVASRSRAVLEPPAGAQNAFNGTTRLQLLGFSHDGKPRTRFKDAELVNESLRVLKVVADESAAARQNTGQFLHLLGLADPNLMGSPILTNTGQLLAVYSDEQDLSKYPKMKAYRGMSHVAPVVAAIGDWFGETLPATAVEVK